ncbi:6155_t:CDS:2, partial [Acaulospora morrowiae]
MEELNFGQKVIIKLDGIRNNKNGQSAAPNHIQNPSISERPLTTRLATTNISVVHNSMTSMSLSDLQNEPVILKRETVSGNHTTHFQRSTHRVEHVDRQTKNSSPSSLRLAQVSTSKTHAALDNNRRPLLQSRVDKIRTLSSSGIVKKSGRTRAELETRRKLSKSSKKQRTPASSKKPMDDSTDDEETDVYSDDGFDEETADQELLKVVKRTLLDYIEVKPSKKLKNGELTWTQFKPYMESLHFPQFKIFLKERDIDAPEKMVYRCLRDLHISRRDVWLKKRRREREQRSQEMMESVEADAPRSDGYTTYHKK